MESCFLVVGKRNSMCVCVELCVDILAFYGSWDATSHSFLYTSVTPAVICTTHQLTNGLTDRTELLNTQQICRLWPFVSPTVFMTNITDRKYNIHIQGAWLQLCCCLIGNITNIGPIKIIVYTVAPLKKCLFLKVLCMFFFFEWSFIQIVLYSTFKKKFIFSMCIQTFNI